MLLISREERYAKAVKKGPKVRLLKAMLQKWNSNIQFNLIVACGKFRAKMRFDEILKCVRVYRMALIFRHTLPSPKVIKA